MLISEAQILDVLRRQNTWWQTGKIPSDLTPFFRRLTFYEIQAFLHQPELKRAVILSGARRVGKTVLLHQIAQNALEDGAPPKKILYITFEDLTLTQANLREILVLYEKNVEAIGEGTFILLDEIHYTSNWGRWLMTIMREYPKARIVATGSAAILLRETPGNESAAGRWVSVHVPTLSFYEYLQLRNFPVPLLNPDLEITRLSHLSGRECQEIMTLCGPLEREFPRYLLQGGFPAFVSEKFTLGMAQRLLREDVIDKALKRDMAHLYGARSLGELDQLFVYLCFNLGAVVEKNTLAKELRVAALTVENHLRRLEDAHLIYRLAPWKMGGKKSLKPRPKIYIADPTLRNAVILRGDGLLANEEEMGRVVEACVFKHLYAFYYPERPRFGYWQGTERGREADFVLSYPNGSTIACEVKYRQRPRLESKDGLTQMLKDKKPPDEAFLITKNNEDYGPLEGGKIFQIPAYLFVYLLGHIELGRWKKAFSPESSAPSLPWNPV